MEHPTGFLRRYGVAILLTVVLVYTYVSSTRPALEERRRLEAERARRRAELEQLESAVERQQGWLRGVNEDPWVQRRLLELQRVSPEVTGPRLLAPEPVGPSGGSGPAGEL